MSRLKIPHNRAIQLLQDRLEDLKKPSIILNALKSRIQDDVMAIFGSGSSQHITSIGLHTSEITSEIKEKSREQFKQTLQGWINYIKDFHLIDQEKSESSEKETKDKYLELLAKWNKLVPEYNQLLEDNESTLRKYDQALREIEILESKLKEKQKLDLTFKILFLGASPIDEVRLRIDEEIREIESGLKRAALRDHFELKSQWAITTQTLRQAMLDQNPTIVHFSGHGGIDGIAVEDLLGNAKLIESTALGDLFELFSSSVECVVLNSCYSESQAKEIAKHISYVIGMKQSVSDKAAIAFSTGFYAALGAGKDFAFAYKMAVASIKLEGISGSDIPIIIG